MLWSERERERGGGPEDAPGVLGREPPSGGGGVGGIGLRLPEEATAAGDEGEEEDEEEESWVEDKMQRRHWRLLDSLPPRLFCPFILLLSYIIVNGPAVTHLYSRWLRPKGHYAGPIKNW